MSALPPVADLLPHRPPMILLDGVVAAELEAVTCRVVLTRESMFMEGDRVQAAVALEWMAQCAGVYAGLRARGRGEVPRIGYLLGTRSLELHVDEFRAGDELIVHAKHVFGDEQIGNFDCHVDRRGERVAAATLSVYQGDLGGHA